MFQTKLFFLLCMFFVNAHADNPTMIFKVTAFKQFAFLPDWETMYLNITGNILLKQMSSTSYLVQLSDLHVNLLIGLDVLDIMSCESTDAAFKKPFIAIYDEKGLFQQVKVANGETNLSSNFKFLLGSLLQLDVTKLVEQDKPQFVASVNELTYHGRCDVDYLIEQAIPNTENKYMVSKTYDVESCTDSSKYFEEEYLNKTCSSQLHMQGITNRKVDLIVQIVSDSLMYDGLSSSEIMNYRPFSNNGDRIIGGVTEQCFAESVTEDELINEVEQMVVDVNEFKYVKSNETLFKEMDGPANNAFIRFYRTFACSPVMNIYTQLFETALVCPV